MDMKLLHGDNIEHLKNMEDNSVDSVVTDPPYGLKFMGKKWDHSVPSVEFWKEVLRVLKPGGHVLSFGGTRTYHRMAVNIEDAGFEIRDQIMWLYGSGFPKSHNISKAIDKKFGAKREVLGYESGHINRPKTEKWKKSNRQMTHSKFKTEKSDISGGGLQKITAPATDQAKQWDGFGTALKPANEPIVLARKPLSEKTIVDNVLKHGTGGLNIDGCRVEFVANKHGDRAFSKGSGKTKKDDETIYMATDKDTRNGFATESLNRTVTQGRFPANIILDEEAGRALDEQVSKTMKMHSAGKARKAKRECDAKGMFGLPGDGNRFGDTGGASRFFYCAKASKRERNAGLEGMEERSASGLPMRSREGQRGGLGIDGTSTDRKTKNQNHHPTVKPVKLMEYLTRLITPPGGTVLDPFMGSGTTGIAAKNEGFGFIGIELNAEYYEIAKKRVNI